MMAAHSLSEAPTLGSLLQGMIDPVPVEDLTIQAVCIDSRKVTPGSLFLALDGTQTSGENYINDAIGNGAVAVLVGKDNADVPDLYSVPVYSVHDLGMKAGLIADRFYGSPSADMTVTGITGTNGKTSVSHFISQALSVEETRAVGIIGTLGIGVYGRLESTINTTPDPITLHSLLARFRDQQIGDVVMEVSSHALEQGRVNGVRFNTAVFTNLSRDHLDYHGDMGAYARAKRKLFMSDGLSHAVINHDDPFGRELLQGLDNQLEVITYGLTDQRKQRPVISPVVNATVLSEDIHSMVLDINSPWGSGDLQLSLSGTFNAYNVLATLCVLCVQGMSFTGAMESLQQLRSVPGRMEFFPDYKSAGIFVDYAHTPHALEQALVFIRSQCKGKLICVFGCGGDRDQGKRSQMGKIAEQFADRVILTSDNPRNEPPGRIIQDILSGMQRIVPVEIEPDRSLAIRLAIETAGKGDIVLVAGKGHETYQEILSNKLPFSDRQLVRNLLGEKQ